MSTPEQLDEAELLSFLDSLSNWSRWGADDELGSLNLINSEARVEAAKLVTIGRSVSCSRTISPKPGPENPMPLLHFMIMSGDRARADGKSMSADWIGMPIHGQTITHIDELAHEFWNGKMYGGRSASLVTTATGASRSNIEVIKDGVVGRGVLLDVPRWLGVSRLEPGRALSATELESCAEAQGVEIKSGDILFVRTGRDAPAPAGEKPGARQAGWAGLHASCLPWLHRRGIAALGSDAITDATPSGYEAIDTPIHLVGIVALGLRLVDNAYLEDLAQVCEEVGRWEFMFVLAPLRLKNSTGSPANPLAIF